VSDWCRAASLLNSPLHLRDFRLAQPADVTVGSKALLVPKVGLGAMSWLLSKGKVDSYSLHLGFKSESHSRTLPQYSRHIIDEDGRHYDGVSITWTDDDREAAVLQRLAGRFPLSLQIHRSPPCSGVLRLCTIFVQNNSTLQRWSYVRFMLGAVAAAGAEADADLVEEQVRVRFRVVSPEDPGGIVSASAPSGGITGGLQ